MDNDIEKLVQWAEAKGVQLDGIKPARLPGRGIGVVATRRLEAGDVFLVVNKEAIRSLHSLPQEIAEKLPLDMPIHGLLAADLALQRTQTPWSALLPKYEDFESGVPFFWPTELQALLPAQAKQVLAKQQDKVKEHFSMLSAAFPDTSWPAFAHAWFLVNSRTFYYETPETSLYSWEDRLALLPIADLFNHSATGCNVAFTSDWYSVTADRTYEEGEEMYISYGDHTNDFLLTEYGFILGDNKWDRICLDDVILPRLSASQRDELKQKDALGKYMLSPTEGPCERTKTALEVLSKSVSAQGKGHEVDGKTGSSSPHLEDILNNLLKMAEDTLSRVQGSEAGSAAQRMTLGSRWEQILTILQQQSRDE